MRSQRVECSGKRWEAVAPLPLPSLVREAVREAVTKKRPREAVEARRCRDAYDPDLAPAGLDLLAVFYSHGCRNLAAEEATP